jgi:hypothetical protein
LLRHYWHSEFYQFCHGEIPVPVEVALMCSDHSQTARAVARATFIDATGAVTITSEFEIIDPRRVLLPRYFSNISDESHHPERSSATAERETLRDDSVRNSVERRSERRSLSVNGRHPRGFACEGAGAPTGSHASENRCNLIGLQGLLFIFRL